MKETTSPQQAHASTSICCLITKMGCLKYKYIFNKEDYFVARLFRSTGIFLYVVNLEKIL